nr:MAG TPA: hypothetical protein [Caudoviricetes sp.]
MYCRQPCTATQRKLREQKEQLLLQNLLENLFHDRPKKPREHKTGETKGQAVSEQ